MARSSRREKARAAWQRIEALGGHGVWEPDVVVASLAGTGVTDDDLVLFRDFPSIQILDLSHTAMSDAGLVHLADLAALEELVVVGTRISGSGLEAFRSMHPTVRVITEPPGTGALNPFTGRPS